MLHKFNFNSWNIDLWTIFEPFFSSNSLFVIIVSKISESFKLDSTVSVNDREFLNLAQFFSKVKRERSFVYHGGSYLGVSQVYFDLSMFIIN